MSAWPTPPRACYCKRISTLGSDGIDSSEFLNDPLRITRDPVPFSTTAPSFRICNATSLTLAGTISPSAKMSIVRAEDAFPPTVSDPTATVWLAVMAAFALSTVTTSPAPGTPWADQFATSCHVTPSPLPVNTLESASTGATKHHKQVKLQTTGDQ